MISRIDHVSIAVKDYENALRLFKDILGAIPGFGDIDQDLKFNWKIFSLGDLSRLEILTPSEEGSFLKNFLSQKQGGVHHITLQTPDIAEARKTLDKNGIPYFGYNEYADHYWKEIFIHPKDAFGVLVQIAEFNPDDWLDDSVKLSGKTKWSIKKSDDNFSLLFSHPGGGTMRQDLTREEMVKLVRDLEDAL
jgi:methylmalonyl-CoA/ethylmalonyl-CoA epimerase